MSIGLLYSIQNSVTIHLFLLSIKVNRFITRREMLMSEHATDNQIIELFFSRNNDALIRTDEKYGVYCRTVSLRILNDSQDVEECINDMLYQAWNSIPPTRPNSLKAYLGKVIRNISLNKLKHSNRQKRAANECSVAFEELENVLTAAHNSVEEHLEAMALSKAINAFLDNQSAQNRKVFIARYWYFEPVSSIAKNLGISESKTKMILLRMRNSLKDYLKKEGVL